MKNKTLLLTSKTELEANQFAMELLIVDDDLKDCKEYTLDQLSRIFGSPESDSVKNKNLKNNWRN